MTLSDFLTFAVLKDYVVQMTDQHYILNKDNNLYTIINLSTCSGVIVSEEIHLKLSGSELLKYLIQNFS